MVIPSATIRLFAIVRTVARYAERLATHDATFRFIAGLRVNVFRSIADGRGELARTRAGVLLARLSSDLDALDGLSIRFATPLFAAAVILTGFAVILWGISPLLAVATITPVLLGGVLAPCLIGVFATRDARRRMLALDAARTRLADLDRGRTELCIAGALAAHAEGVAAASKLAAETEFRLIQLAAGLRLAGSLGKSGRHPRRAAQRGGSGRLTQCNAADVCGHCRFLLLTRRSSGSAAFDSVGFGALDPCCAPGTAITRRS